jgi:hypothetical protein
MLCVQKGPNRNNGMLSPGSATVTEQATTTNCPDTFQLLWAIARPANAAGLKQIATFAENVNDWAALLRLAFDHRVLPVLYVRLIEANADVPPDVLTYLREEYERNFLHALGNAVELVELLQVFNQNGILAMPYKGVVLSVCVYHDLTVRMPGDLDILIRRQDLEAAKNILLSRGHTRIEPETKDDAQIPPGCFEYTFQRLSDGMITELRWKLELITSSGFSQDLGLSWVWPRRRTTLLAGAEVQCLDPETMLIVLCMHGAKHVWSRLVWICDVAQLLTVHSEFDWPAIISEAKQLGLWRSVALGVLLARQISGITIPAYVLQQFQADSTVTQLSQHIQATLFDTPGRPPGGRIPYNLQLLSLRDRLKAAFSIQVLEPNERDRAFLRLPKALHPFYYLIRPVRLLLDKSAR